MTRNSFSFQCAFIVFGLVVSALAFAHPSNKWRLQFSGGSHSEGEIVLQFSPKGGDAFTVHIPVPAGESENAVAKTVTKVLRDKLPSDAFHVERDDGEDVLIKKKHGTADFDLIVVFNSVKHVRINPDRE